MADEETETFRNRRVRKRPEIQKASQEPTVKTSPSWVEDVVESAPPNSFKNGRDQPVGSWGQREAGILSVALKLFGEEGYENCSMARVAAAAGLSEGTLYNYFHDKLDLVLKATLDSLEQRVSAAVRIVDQAESLQGGLQQLIALHLGAILENEEVYRIWAREIRASKAYRKSATRDALARFANQFLQLLTKFDLDNALANGLTPQMMRDIVFGGSEHIGRTALIQQRKDQLNVQEIANAMAEVYIRGFGLEGRSPPAKRTIPPLRINE